MTARTLAETVMHGGGDAAGDGRDDAPADVRTDVLDHLLVRYSIGPKHLAAPGPDARALRLAARAALRAPDHRHLVPFRFAVVPHGRRDALGRLFERVALRNGHDAAQAAIEARRAWNGPVLVAVIARIVADHPEVPPHEQWITVGGALTNFLDALHLMGYGAKVLSGRKAADPEVRDAFCRPGETLVGWIVAGTPTARATARHDDDPDAVLADW